MSEEKLYAVKNDKGKWADGGDYFGNYAWATPDKDECERDAKQKGGHVVTLIEEPEKVVLSKEEAKIVEDAHNAKRPASYIILKSNDEGLLMNAYVNGYTVKKEKKYLVYKVLGGKQKNKHEQVAQAYRSNLFFDTIIWLIKEHKIMSSDASDQFTEAEIEHYGLQDCEKEEVTDDGMGC